MKLFIGNTTKQIIEFLYRVPENPQIINQKIGIGEQVMIYKDASSDVIDYILEQHEKYGLIKVDEIDRSKNFIGCCYSIDRPIDVKRIMYALEHNDEILIEKGIESRKTSVAALNENLVKNAEEMGANVTRLSTQIVEQPKKGGTDLTMDETITVEKANEGKRGRK